MGCTHLESAKVLSTLAEMLGFLQIWATMDWRVLDLREALFAIDSVVASVSASVSDRALRRSS